MTRSSPAKLTVESHGIPHAVEDSWRLGPQRRLPSLSSLLDYFRSQLRTSESHRNVTLEMFSLRVIVKRSREKSNWKKQRNTNTLL